MISFTDQVVVVTGAGRGLGRSHALEFARRGASVVVNDIGRTDDGRPSAVAVAQEIVGAGGHAVADQHGVHDPEESVAIVRDALERFGKVDVFINNAGVSNFVPFDALLLDRDFDRLHGIHVRGPFVATQAAYRSMCDQGYGRIVMTSSSAGVFGRPQGAAYCAAKMGVVGLMNGIASEAAQSGVLVNALCPSADTNIDWNKAAFDEQSELFLTRTAAYRSPDFTSPLLVYLASRECRVSGHIFSSMAGRYAWLFMAANEGWMVDDPTPPTVEEISRHFDVIDEPRTAIVPTSVTDEAMSIVARRKPADQPLAEARNESTE